MHIVLFPKNIGMVLSLYSCYAGRKTTKPICHLRTPEKWTHVHQWIIKWIYINWIPGLHMLHSEYSTFFLKKKSILSILMDLGVLTGLLKSVFYNTVKLRNYHTYKWWDPQSCLSLGQSDFFHWALKSTNSSDILPKSHWVHETSFIALWILIRFPFFLPWSFIVHALLHNFIVSLHNDKPLLHCKQYRPLAFKTD